MNTAALPTITVTPIGHRTARVAIPTVELPAVAWEIILPRAVIAPAGLSNLTFTDQGLYLEDAAGRWDYIPYAELAALLKYGPDATVTLPPLPHTNGNGRVAC